MSLSDWLVVLSLSFTLYGFGRWLWSVYGPGARPQQAPATGASVKTSRRAPKFRRRSARSNVQNPVNAGSGQQEAVQPPVNVQPVEPAAAAPASPAGDVPAAGDGFTLSARELAQLAEALQLRGEGATVEAAVSRAFGVTKGGSEGWKRAKALFDAATVVPGAAPAGTYAAPTRPQKRRRAVGRA